MSPRYRLTYFNGRGRCEVMRLILCYGGVEFEDRRLTCEEWKNFKSSTPFGQLPLLEVDGEVVCQSNAGARYLAKQFGLYGANDWEAAKIDMIVECVEDIVKPFITLLYCECDNQKGEMKRKYEEEQLPNYLSMLQKMLTNGGTGEYFVGNKLSLADIHCTYFLSFPDPHIRMNLQNFPKIQALKNRVEKLPSIKAWIEKRPHSNF